MKPPQRRLKTIFLSPASLEGTETQRMFDFSEGNRMKSHGIGPFLVFWAKPIQFVVPLCELCDSARDYFLG